MSGLDHRKQIEQIEENQYEEYEYNNTNTEEIYDYNIDYYEEIYQEELDGILEDTERKPKYHQYRDKENYEYAEEENDNQDMKMEHPEQ